MKQHPDEAEYQPSQAASVTPSGFDPICTWLQSKGHQLTLKNYLEVGYGAKSLDELTPEDQGQIPAFLMQHD